MPHRNAEPLWCARLLHSQQPVLILLLLSVSATAQVFEVQGGSSTLFQADGASFQVRAPNYQASVGAGFLNGHFRFGASASEQWKDTIIGAGDSAIPVQLPTDIFDASHYFLARGASVSWKKGRTQLFGFGGATTVGFASPFFSGATAENKSGVFFLDTSLTTKLKVFSRNIVSQRQTSISGVEWSPQKWLRASMAGGIGANQSYWSSSVAAGKEWGSLKASYAFAGSEFQRISVTTPLSSENDRENVLATFHPVPWIDLTAGRFNLLQPAITGQAFLHATVNEYLATTRVARFTAGGSLFQSIVKGVSNQGTAFFVQRDLGRRFQAGEFVYHSQTANGPSTTSTVTSVREMISPRLTLLALINHSCQNNSVSFGGQFVSNPMSVDVEYQTVYAPFSPGNPFKQVLVLTARLQPFGFLRLNLGSNIAPNGSVKYTSYGQASVYHGAAAPSMPSTYRFPKYVVTGVVVDENGSTVSGAAVMIGKELIFSDQSGAFFVRFKNRRQVDMRVMRNEFRLPGQYEVISCPARVVPSPQDSQSTIAIVLHKKQRGN